MTRLVNETVRAGAGDAVPRRARGTEMLAGTLCPGSPLPCPPLPQPFCKNLYFCPLFPLPALCAAPAAPGGTGGSAAPAADTACAALLPLPRSFEACWLK